MSRYILSTAPQGTPEWHLARAGRLTGSRADAVYASDSTATRRDYLCQLALERLTGEPAADAFVTRDMRHGIEQEPFARMAYEAATGEIVREAGFAYLPTVMAGCSVDGFIGDDGFFEAKCPKSATHIGYLLSGRLPDEYVPQLLHNFWITDCKFAVFASYDPRTLPPLQLFTVRIERDEAAVDAYATRAMRFLFEVSDLETQLRERCAA